MRDGDRVAEVVDRRLVVQQHHAHSRRARELADLLRRRADVHRRHSVVAGVALRRKLDVRAAEARQQRTRSLVEGPRELRPPAPAATRAGGRSASRTARARPGTSARRRCRCARRRPPSRAAATASRGACRTASPCAPPAPRAACPPRPARHAHRMRGRPAAPDSCCTAFTTSTQPFSERSPGASRVTSSSLI